MAQQEKEVAALEARINRFPLVVTYAPLSGEAAFSELISLTAPAFPLPPSPALDPLETAAELAARVDGAAACVLLPGRAFDARGTRHGRGGGWYDRFLSAVPETWLRIGFCLPEHFSDIPLPRKEWDQPVDVLVIAGGDAAEPLVIETNARPGIHLLS